MSDLPKAPLLLEIGCEEIPARMIPRAAVDLERRVLAILDQAGLDHAASRSWGGSRRLAVRVEHVASRQADRSETVTGPPASVAFDAAGALTRAGSGFAGKQGVAPEALERIETERGVYVGFRRDVVGRELGAILAEALPPAVAGMSFPKTMRWAQGEDRWVRPVHWLLALHGDRALSLELFGVRAGAESWGHRFLGGGGPVSVPDVDAYVSALAAAHVVVDPAERRRQLAERLERAAAESGGALIGDPDLLEEVVDLVEWPGVVCGAFDAAFLELPAELLVTTLRHHQKCFSVSGSGGALLPVFLAVANTDRDPAGHIRRGNEWVVSGRLEDARFFWNEDRKRPMVEKAPRLADVVFHAKAGSYANKADRMATLTARLAERLQADPEDAEAWVEAARMAKVDLVTGTVGEFPELQGQVGGLLLEQEGRLPSCWRAVYEHYRPSGPDDPLPETGGGAAVSAADKLDSIATLLGAGERVTGSRDPLGLRRAGNGVIRIALERSWPTSIDDLSTLAGGGEATVDFLGERLEGVLREEGYSTNEVRAVLRPAVPDVEARHLPLGDLLPRLRAISAVRGREDFRNLVKLTERVDTILTRNAERRTGRTDARDPVEPGAPEAALGLARMVEEMAPLLRTKSGANCYDEVVELLARFIDPVERFFADVLVVDEQDPETTDRRLALLERLRDLLTRDFDVRELAGQAERR